MYLSGGGYLNPCSKAPVDGRWHTRGCPPHAVMNIRLRFQKLNTTETLQPHVVFTFSPGVVIEQPYLTLDVASLLEFSKSIAVEREASLEVKARLVGESNFLKSSAAGRI